MNGKLLYALIVGPLDIAATIFFDLFVNWWAALFADEYGWLPRWLKWAQTFDASLDTGVTEAKIGTSRSVWWNRTRWLYRNSAYGFSYYVLGIKFDPGQWTVKRWDSKVFYATSSNGFFNYQYQSKRLSFKLGWKAWNMFDEDTQTWRITPWGPLWRIPAVFSVASSLWGKR